MAELTEKQLAEQMRRAVKGLCVLCGRELFGIHNGPAAGYRYSIPSYAHAGGGACIDCHRAYYEECDQRARELLERHG